MFKKKYFKMETGTEYEAYNNTNYDSNYNEIFDNNSLELDEQTSLIDKLDTQLDGKSLSETDYRDKINKFFQDDGLLIIFIPTNKIIPKVWLILICCNQVLLHP